MHNKDINNPLYYRLLPPLNPFHALLRSIVKIGDRDSRARKSEAIGMGIFFLLHWSFAPFIFFCIGINKLSMKIHGYPFPIIGMVEGVVLFFVIGVFLRFVKDACCYRRVHDFGYEKPKTLSDVYVVGAKNQLLVPIVGWLLIGMPLFSYNRGDKHENSYGPSPAYVYVGPEEELAFKKRYRRTMICEIVSFIIGIACIAAFVYFAFFWKGKDVRENFVTEATVDNSNNNDIDVDVNDVLGTWVELRQSSDGKVDTTNIIELKKIDGKNYITIKNFPYKPLEGFLVEETVALDSIKSPRLHLKADSLVHTYYIADNDGVIETRFIRDRIDKVLDGVDSRGNLVYKDVDRTISYCSTYLNICCNKDTSLLNITIVESNISNYFYKKAFVKDGGNSKKHVFYGLRRTTDDKAATTSKKE